MSYKESPIEPSIGRIVLVRGMGITPDRPGIELPAIITKVWAKENLSVHVFGDVSQPMLDGIKYNGDPEACPDYAWRWMVYQVQVAKDRDAKSGEVKPETVFDRVQAERRELADRLRKLRIFQATPAHKELTGQHAILLESQAATMEKYLQVLIQRVQLLAVEV